MKTLKLNIAIIFFGLTLFSACNSGGTEQKENEQTKAKQEVAGVTYTCPMHPEVVSHEPGKCPKCGMNLEKVEVTGHQHKAGEQH